MSERRILNHNKKEDRVHNHDKNHEKICYEKRKERQTAERKKTL